MSKKPKFFKIIAIAGASFVFIAFLLLNFLKSPETQKEIFSSKKIAENMLPTPTAGMGQENPFSQEVTSGLSKKLQKGIPTERDEQFRPEDSSSPNFTQGKLGSPDSYTIAKTTPTNKTGTQTTTSSPEPNSVSQQKGTTQTSQGISGQPGSSTTSQSSEPLTGEAAAQSSSEPGSGQTPNPPPGSTPEGGSSPLEAGGLIAGLPPPGHGESSQPGAQNPGARSPGSPQGDGPETAAAGVWSEKEGEGAGLDVGGGICRSEASACTQREASEEEAREFFTGADSVTSDIGSCMYQEGTNWINSDGPLQPTQEYGLNIIFRVSRNLLTEDEAAAPMTITVAIMDPTHFQNHNARKYYARWNNQASGQFQFEIIYLIPPYAAEVASNYHFAIFAGYGCHPQRLIYAFQREVGERGQLRMSLSGTLRAVSQAGQ